MSLPPGRAEAGRYLRRDQAEDRALVVLALGLPYWIVPEEGLYLLVVKEGDVPAVARELEKYEQERLQDSMEERARASLHSKGPGSRFSPLSLFVYAWAMGGFFLLQRLGPADWTARGTAESGAILHGEWWRTLTALTLHADLGHLVANVGVGLLFAGALLPWLGSGWTWLGLVLSGALGNAINAWGFRGAAHSSIGASTAVFGGLGILVGWQVFAILAHTGRFRRPRLRELLIPVAAGLALLAYLGTGDETARVDFMAHLFGMLAGGLVGFGLAWSGLPQRTSPAMQRGLAVAALLLPCLGWAFAWRSS